MENVLQSFEIAGLLKQDRIEPAFLLLLGMLKTILTASTDKQLCYVFQRKEG